MDEGLKPAARFFEAYFHKDCLPGDHDWESVVERFKEVESQETRIQTRTALLRLAELSSDDQLEEFLFREPRSFYDPRPDGWSLRAWIETVVHLLAGGSPRSSDRDRVATSRRQAIDVARKTLSGEKDILLGARELSSLRFDVGLPEDDPDFLCFVGIDSETDRFPLGAVRARWSAAALAEMDVEIERSRQWAREFGQAALENVVRRFGGAG